MEFMKRMTQYWLLLVVVLFWGFVGAFNTDSLYVHIPLLGELKAKAVIIYLTMFLLGCAVTTLYLGLDSLKKSFKIRQLTKEKQKLGIPQAKTSSIAKTKEQDDSPTVAPKATEAH